MNQNNNSKPYYIKNFEKKNNPEATKFKPKFTHNLDKNKFNNNLNNNNLDKNKFNNNLNNNNLENDLDSKLKMIIQQALEMDSVSNALEKYGAEIIKIRKEIEQSNLTKPETKNLKQILEKPKIEKEIEQSNLTKPETKNLKKILKEPKIEISDESQPTYISKKAFIGGNRKKIKKTYVDEYEQDRDFKLNIYKKNIYATPYFQEKKKRNDFIGKKPKPKEEESWKKKHKKKND